VPVPVRKCPHIGAAIIIVKAWDENTSPASKSRLRPILYPSWCTYKGKNGKILENPTAVISWAKNRIYSVRCQGVCSAKRIFLN
jgi:hypothetical protein